jgi:rubrerythrin
VKPPPVTATPEDVREELEEDYRNLQERAERRERRGGYAFGYRCWDCRKFVGSPTGRCPHCGALHGGGYHDAYASR